MANVANQIPFKISLLLLVAISHLLLLWGRLNARIRVEHAIFICLNIWIEKQLFTNLYYFLRSHYSNDITVARDFTQSFSCRQNHQTFPCLLCLNILDTAANFLRSVILNSDLAKIRHTAA